MTWSVGFSAKELCGPMLSHIDGLLDHAEAGTDGGGGEGRRPSYSTPPITNHDRSGTGKESPAEGSDGSSSDSSTGSATAAAVEELGSFQERYPELFDAVNGVVAAVAAADASAQSRIQGT